MSAPAFLAALWRPAFFSVAPVTIIGAMVWAQAEYRNLHPAAAALKPATISSALNDPRIAGPVVMALLFAAPFLALSILQVVRFHWRCIHRVWPRGTPENRYWRRLVLLAVLLQLGAALGLALAVHFPSDSHSAPHLAGSYLLFMGHAGSILLSGHIGPALTRAATDGRAPELELSRFWMRWPASIFIVTLALGYGVLFYAPELDSIVPGYGYHLAVAVVELTTISSFLIYLMSYGWELFHADYRRLTAPGRLTAG